MTATEPEEPLVTRIYVSGLPPSITSEQLRLHFQGEYPVTDAHVIADRRIGFVGFPSHEDAKNAVRHFNRSFIRMSKISVTLARPVEVKRDGRGQAAPVSQRSLRQRPENGQNQDAISRKRKRETDDSGREGADLQRTNGLQKPRTEGESKEDGDSRQTVEQDQKTGEASVETTEENQAEVVAQSDSDWLRGKTSRLLDLVEGDGAARQRPSKEAVRISPISDVPAKAEKQEDATDVERQELSEQTATVSVPNARLFVRNLPFDTREEDLRAAFSAYGRISEIHLVTDTRKSIGKGLGYVQYVEPQDAEKALSELDGRDFRGRLMHVLPASDKKIQNLSEFELSKLPLKKQKAIKRKTEASKATFSWNSLYMNPDAVLASVAGRLGVSKADLLDPSSADAAVKQAHAETSVIKETKDDLRSHGVNIDAFKTQSRDDRTILLKNFSFGTTAEELSEMLRQYGTVERLVFPTTGTMAVAQYSEPNSATLALKQLAYRNLRGSVLYLEKAPRGLWEGGKDVANPDNPVFVEDTNGDVAGTTATVFVRNLNFATTTARLVEAFAPLPGFLSARVKTRTDAKRPGEVLSMGFGFVEFRSKAQAEAAASTMNGRRLDGHELLAQLSQKSTDLGEERRKEDIAKKIHANKTKIIVKNLPFEATKKDIRALFGAYGQLRTIRMPKKFDSTARGFAFAEFVTAKEAENAIEALSNTHLLGRRLVLDFAEGETVDPEAEIRAMEKKVQGHQNSLTHHRMTGSARKKFNVDARDDVEPL
ncbi:Multiple RNA-binding domain-containing protein 1 [Exophiala xenobiotica]|nr:Multiple RNA-binding domain-containing protein 1 [Exophiala xenobiotica]KAK5252126.1 Multiple RNA-binding domain-containing protein 1 [Exophiala xenobiotica]KAK5356484.1 Multiple RNA-binding domain-containing protein 1 [Exophiala xenobiotica]KAK5370954.1 Multiple RNA-binding domain-containing protein 1 [Exophiala xenobiotica]KAK5389694.1 Multiple RNA-binding domain-containing protein 1 [Exophiala xenobiotica]